MTRFLFVGVLLVSAAWATGAAISAAMTGNADRLIGFAALAISALSFAGLTLIAGKQ